MPSFLPESTSPKPTRPQPTRPQPTRPTATNRRTFLRTAAAVGTAAWTSSGATDSSTAQAQDTAKPRVDPTAGLASIKKLLNDKTPITWVFTGDSITHGALHTLGWRSYPEHFAERVRWEMRRVRDVVINTGISGDRTSGILADLNWRVLRFGPDVASFMFGMNDCSAGPAGRDAFRKNVNQLIDRSLEARIIPILNTPNTVYVANSKGREDLPAYAEIVRTVASERNVVLVDHWEHWQKAKPNQEDLLPWIEDKSIHPGVFGHREFAKLIFRALDIFDASSPTCGLEVP